MRALYTLVLDIIFIENLCRELGRPVKLPAIVFEDNLPVIDLCQSISARLKKSKHFLMLIDFVREQVLAGLIDIRKVDTTVNIADILTKIVTGPPFLAKAASILGIF